ncbi:unnamed protein product [Brassicogethes aeneus]|uniref:hydroxymethylbilane synthase n=1 Tax=Brassicogethes aeneus TaxID=1431903 RepID=A0A9P0FI59_BRAAE|nr:unnamed protein product [Brassicogethes aeneus]
MSQDKKIRVGSRKSELALIQTRHVISLLKDLNPNKEFEIVTMNTLGDKVLDIPLPKIGEKSLFTKELEAALSTSCVDFVVHSLKDLPTTLPPGMAIGAVLTREDPRDALVLQKSIKNASLQTLSKGSVVGTSSLRRTAQLAKKYPHLKVENIRGNLNTRLKKLDDLGKYHAIILAAAGLIRMGWNDRISKILEPEEILYAVGQGALAVECRENDENTIKLLAPLYDLHTALRVISERSFMKTLGGGCSAPVAISSELINVAGSSEYKLNLKGAVWSLDGTEEVVEEGSCGLFLRELKKCASCPFNTRAITTSIEDMECLKECKKCPNKSSEEKPSKRQKLDEDILSDMLKNDPHEHCPVKMPIGSDFMGKCPYLESHSKAGKCPVNATMEGTSTSTELYQQCPFMKNGNLSIIENEILKTDDPIKESENLYCGLVLHKEAPLEVFLKSLNLGKDLALKLAKKGALEIMTKAQAVIHSEVAASSKS